MIQYDCKAAKLQNRRKKFLLYECATEHFGDKYMRVTCCVYFNDTRMCNNVWDIVGRSLFQP